MAVVRKTLSEVMSAGPDVNQARLAQISDGEIRQQIADDPDTAPELTLEMLTHPRNLRQQLHMTQQEFAAALGIPAPTLRKWEEGEVSIDPAGRSLLILVARDPVGTLAALAAARPAA